jgi:hypothetical protein
MKSYLTLVLIIAALFAASIVQTNRIKNIKSDRDRLSKNQDIMQRDIDRYQVSDSLYAVSVQELSFTLNEYKKYRSEDLQTIKWLKNDISRLQGINKANLKTIYDLTAIDIRDSIVYRDNYRTDTIRCVNYNDNYLLFSGCFDKTKFSGRIESRDSLIITEHIIPKRFLGFLWKYGVKERRREILSKNPYTKIIDAEFVSIRK